MWWNAVFIGKQGENEWVIGGFSQWKRDRGEREDFNCLLDIYGAQLNQKER